MTTSQHTHNDKLTCSIRTAIGLSTSQTVPVSAPDQGHLNNVRVIIARVSFVGRKFSVRKIPYRPKLVRKIPYRPKLSLLILTQFCAVTNNDMLFPPPTIMRYARSLHLRVDHTLFKLSIRVKHLPKVPHRGNRLYGLLVDIPCLCVCVISARVVQSF